MRSVELFTNLKWLLIARILRDDVQKNQLFGTELFDPNVV